jgi:excisionase family DNA binding protein
MDGLRFGQKVNFFTNGPKYMSEMLTAKEMQSLLQVDRSTIYRMAESGRLPAIKVGKQWRFPADKVENWFQNQMTVQVKSFNGEKAALNDSHEQDLATLLPLECVQLIQGTFAELLDVMLVVTDLDGNPITQPSHACGLFQAISDVPQALQKCIQSWREIGNAIELEPQFSRSHLGLLCARALIPVGSELKGMVVAGCVAPGVWPPNEAEVEQMATKFGVSSDQIQSQIDDVHYLDAEQRKRVLDTLQRIANIVAHIVNERKTLVGRLAAIADLTTL